MLKKSYLMLLPALFAVSDVNAMENTKSDAPRVLIVYYSLSGNTADVANAIQDATGGDIYRIELVNDYPANKKERREQLMAEIEQNYLPPLREPGPNIAEYDIIFLGSPVWGYHLSQPVKSFLRKYDLSGKTVIPFASHGGGGRSRLFSDVANLCVGCNVDTNGWSSWGGGRQPGLVRWLKNKLDEHK